MNKSWDARPPTHPRNRGSSKHTFPEGLGCSATHHTGPDGPPSLWSIHGLTYSTHLLSLYPVPASRSLGSSFWGLGTKFPKARDLTQGSSTHSTEAPALNAPGTCAHVGHPKEETQLPGLQRVPSGHCSLPGTVPRMQAEDAVLMPLAKRRGLSTAARSSILISH